MAPIVIHPGFVKTATSTLQRHIFARHPRIAFLGLPAPSPELEWAVRHVCQADSIHLEPARLRRVFADHLDSIDADRTALISYENYALYESTDKGLVAQRLKTLFPQASVLFTIRRQEDLVSSWYLTKLRVRIKRKAYVPFDEWYWMQAREPWDSILDDLAFGKLIGHYADLFGEDRIHVIPFEWLKHDRGAFAERLSGLFGIAASEIDDLLTRRRENVAMSQAYLDFWRRFSPLMPRKLVRKWSRRMPMDRGAPARVEHSPEIKEHLRNLVAADNAALARRFNLDLASLGYSLAPSS